MSRTTPVTSRLPNDAESDNDHADMITVFEAPQFWVADRSPYRESTPRITGFRGRSRERSGRAMRLVSPDTDQVERPWRNRYADRSMNADAGPDRPGRRLLHERFERRRSSERTRGDNNGVDVYVYRRHGRVQSSPPTHSRPSTLRLSEYDGRTHLQTHILKYFNVKKHNNWSDDEGVAH